MTRFSIFAATALVGLAIQSATAQEIVTFPARASNIAEGDYWTLVEFNEADNTTVLDLNVQRWDGNSWEGSKPGSNANSDQFDWNVPLYAPADGEIVSCWKNSPDNDDTDTIRNDVNNTANSGNGVTKTIFGGGNHVVILTDAGNAISLNHFRQGTIPNGLCPSNDDGKVAVPSMAMFGDFRAAAFIDAADRPRVVEGQFLGRVGSSGNSGGPHLHMSMQPVQSVRASDGRITLGNFVPIRLRHAWAHKFVRTEKDRPENWFRYRGSQLSANHEPKFKLIHPAPFLRRGTATAGAVKSAMDVAYLNSARAVTATIGADDGNAKLIVWDQVGIDTINRRGSFSLGAAKDVRLGLTSSNRFLVAIRQADDRLKVIAFAVTPDGRLVRRGEDLAGPISALDMATTLGSNKRAVVAARGGDGRLRLISYAIGFSGGTETVERMGTAVGPEISALSVSDAGNFRGVLTALRVDGELLVLPWRMNAQGTSFTQGNAGEAGAVGANLDVARLAAGVAAAMIDSNGKLRIITWETNADGDVIGARKGTVTAHDGLQHKLLQSPASGSNLSSVMRGTDGRLYLVGWGVNADGSRLRRLSSARTGEAAALAADTRIRSFTGQDPREYLLTALRDGSGNLRLISWDTNLENP